MAKDKVPIHWVEAPDDNDLAGAESFLALLADRERARTIVKALRRAANETFRAKDILRAAGLSPLPADNVHVAESITKAATDDGLSPILLLRGDITRGVPLLIVDGFHRVCAAYHLREDADVPCRIVSARS